VGQKCNEETHVGGGGEGHIYDAMPAGHGSPLASFYDLGQLQCLTEMWFGENAHGVPQRGRTPFTCCNSRHVLVYYQSHVEDNENDVTANEPVL